MARMRFKRGMNVSGVVRRLTRTVLSLYVGGTILTELGNVMNGTVSSFYRGLSLIGWTVSTAGADINTITATNGSGILSVVGIVALAQIVTSFISF